MKDLVREELMVASVWFLVMLNINNMFEKNFSINIFQKGKKIKFINVQNLLIYKLTSNFEETNRE